MEEAKNNFIKYVEKYLQLNSILCLKKDHTFRVMKLCEMIAKSLNFTKKDLELIKLCGLLHDIGRFEQWKRYETLVDLKSVDHGNLGVEVLKENNFIRKFNKNEEDDELIFKTVYYHSKYKIDANLTEREKTFCNIVRDADKLDILYLYTTEEIKVDIKNHNFSDKIYKKLIDRNLILMQDRVTDADKLSTSLAFVFDLNYQKSLIHLKIKNYINKEIDLYIKKTENKKMQEQLKNIKLAINNYIEKRLENVR